jgi:hypothetical protein
VDDAPYLKVVKNRDELWQAVQLLWRAVFAECLDFAAISPIAFASG